MEFWVISFPCIFVGTYLCPRMAPHGRPLIWYTLDAHPLLRGLLYNPLNVVDSHAATYQRHLEFLLSTDKVAADAARSRIQIESEDFVRLELGQETTEHSSECFLILNAVNQTFAFVYTIGWFARQPKQHLQGNWYEWKNATWERLFFYKHEIASKSRWSIAWVADFYRDGHGHTSSWTRTVLLSILQCCWTSTFNKDNVETQCFQLKLSVCCLKKRCLNVATLQHKDASNMKNFIHDQFEKQFSFESTIVVIY